MSQKSSVMQLPQCVPGTLMSDIGERTSDGCLPGVSGRPMSAIADRANSPPLYFRVRGKAGAREGG